ncbi:class I SAM-dependent methyltransferase [Streptomyces smaragdinus]|uniref:class I SAM-dependent methyltransferase n=1 Tax=Streptomyces smaragdinus TaxID=2585196 RepID=UPI0018865F47|nr:class I SAM-dependent methyltransferase [Streptomyces smaragdinus]
MSDQTVHFDELAELYRRFAADTDILYRPWLRSRVPERGGRAVDLGCGSGRFTGMLAERYGSVLAVDVAEREIAMARAAHPYPNVDFRVCGFEEVTAAADGTFDLVFSVNTLHHREDYAVVLPRIRELLAPGGHAVLMDIVDRGAKSHEWLVEEAFRDARDSYLHRSRDADMAADILRLRLHPVWMRLNETQTVLTREEFHRVYGAAFPGAEFADDIHHAVCAVHWVNS